MTDNAAQLPESLPQAIALLQAQQRELQALRTTNDAILRAVVHDLRAPLRHLISFAPLLEDSVQQMVQALPVPSAEADDAVEFAQTMAASAGKLAAMVDGLQRLSQWSRHPVQLHPVQLQAWLPALLQALPDGLGTKVQLLVDESVPAIALDTTLMQAALTEALRNAAIATRANVDPQIQLRVSAPSDHLVCVAVVDNGLGADTAIADRIGALFLKLHPERVFEGQGMGLAIMRKLVEKIVGQLEVRTQPHQGFEVRMLFVVDGNAAAKEH